MTISGVSPISVRGSIATRAVMTPTRSFEDSVQFGSQSSASSLKKSALALLIASLLTPAALGQNRRNLPDTRDTESTMVRRGETDWKHINPVEKIQRLAEGLRMAAEESKSWEEADQNTSSNTLPDLNLLQLAKRKLLNQETSNTAQPVATAIDAEPLDDRDYTHYYRPSNQDELYQLSQEVYSTTIEALVLHRGLQIAIYGPKGNPPLKKQDLQGVYDGLLNDAAIAANVIIFTNFPNAKPSEAANAYFKKVALLGLLFDSFDLIATNPSVGLTSNDIRTTAYKDGNLRNISALDGRSWETVTDNNRNTMPIR